VKSSIAGEAGLRGLDHQHTIEISRQSGRHTEVPGALGPPAFSEEHLCGPPSPLLLAEEVEVEAYASVSMVLLDLEMSESPSCLGNEVSLTSHIGAGSCSVIRSGAMPAVG
jgi:hypothetical protein